MHAFSQNSPLWHPEQHYGNYQLLRLLGRGGLADVYLGRHVYLRTRAAIKVVRSLDDFDVQAFFEEARIAARLHHPNIIRVLDFDLEDEVPFLVMDYAAGGSVRSRYPVGTKLPVAVMLDYVEQVAGALHYIHSQGLIHRDIKPENLLLDRNGRLLLSDFGIAIAVQNAGVGEQTLLGTISYMAPEQIEDDCCPESDQYALAVMVYEWLSGSRPFRGTTDEIVEGHLYTTPPSLLAAVPDMPPAVEEVVFRALAKDPQNRFEDVQDFAAALRHAFASKPLVLRAASIPPRPEQNKRTGHIQRQTMVERERQRTRGESKSMRETSKLIATFYFIDLLIAAAIWGLLALLGASSPFIEAFLAVFMTVLPLAGGFLLENNRLCLLTGSLAVAAALCGFLSHTLIVFNVVYTALLILSLLVAFTVGLNGP